MYLCFYHCNLLQLLLLFQILQLPTNSINITQRANNSHHPVPATAIHVIPQSFLFSPPFLFTPPLLLKSTFFQQLPVEPTRSKTSSTLNQRNRDKPRQPILLATRMKTPILPTKDSVTRTAQPFKRLTQHSHQASLLKETCCLQVIDCWKMISALKKQNRNKLKLFIN